MSSSDRAPRVPSSSPAETPSLRRKGRWWLLGGLPLVLVLGAIAALPTVLTQTAIGRRFIQTQVARSGVDLEADRISLGWFSPAEIVGLQATDRDDRWSFSARNVSSQQSLWDLLWSGGDWGEFRLVEPTVLVQPPPVWERGDRPAIESPPADVKPATRRLQLTVTDARVLVRHGNPTDEQESTEPMTFLQGADVMVRYEQVDVERVLTIEPGKPLDHVELTPEMCQLGLKYVLPVLADVAWTQGSLSLELDSCRIPLHHPPSSEVIGRLTVHSVEAGLRESKVREIIEQVARWREIEALPKSLKLADETEVSFRVHDGIVEHQNLAFGLPEVSPRLVIHTQGAVHLDGQLDLIAQIPIPAAWLGEGPLAQTLQKTDLRLPIRGTLQEPQVSWDKEGDWSDILTDLGLPLLQDPSVVDDALQRLRDLREQRRQRLDEPEDPSARPGLLQRLRERRRP